MNSVATLISDMVRAGVDPDLIGRTAAALAEREPVKVIDEQAERRRAKDRERKRLRNSAESAETKKEIPPTPPKEKNIPPSPPKGGSSPTGFSDFWAVYPHKVGKRAAEKAFVKARQRADLDAIMAGLRRYVAKTDDRHWCNPATWLNQDRWEDAPAPVQPRQGQPPPREDGFAKALREDLERERMKRHEPPDHETTGYLDASVTGTDQSGAGIVELFAAQGVRR